MRAMNRMLVAGLLAGALLVAPMGLSVTTGGAGPGLGLAPAVPTAYAAINSHPTGNSELDELCRQAADLINHAEHQGDLAIIFGDPAEGQAWYELANEMKRRAQGWGCIFSIARAEVGENLQTFEETPAGPEQGADRPPLGDNRPPLRPDVAIAEADHAPSTTITETQPTTAAIPGPAGQRLPDVPGPVIEIAPADLQVGAVDVKGPEGGRCVIDGRNVVTATIKNAGGESAGQFRVEVKVSNQRRDRQTVSGLGPNAETTLPFQNFPIFEGERSLQVVVDPDNTVKEGDETNNTRTVAVDCTRR